MSSLEEPDLKLPQPYIEPLSVLDNTNVFIFSLEENSGSRLYEWIPLQMSMLDQGME
jgi:hypothetical protein